MRREDRGWKMEDRELKIEDRDETKKSRIEDFYFTKFSGFERLYAGTRSGASYFYITKTFPQEERYSLTDQIRRSSRAVNAMIAEAWGRRRYEAAFANKINEAFGEAMETQAWLDHALDCQYLVVSKHKELDDTWQYIGAMLQRMIDQADKFCKNSSK